MVITAVDKMQAILLYCSYTNVNSFYNYILNFYYISKPPFILVLPAMSLILGQINEMLFIRL